MGVGRALLWGVPRNANLGAEMGAWVAAGVLGPTLILVGSWQPQICLLLMRSPSPVLSAPLMVWVWAALARSAHHWCECPTAPALLSIPGGGKFGFGGRSSLPGAFSFCLLCWKPLWCCMLAGELGMSPPKWAPGAGGCTQGICSPGGRDDLGMKKERPEGSGCTLGFRAGPWGVRGVQRWPMGCSQGTRGQQGPAAASTAGCSGNSGASPCKPATGGIPDPAGGEHCCVLLGVGILPPGLCCCCCWSPPGTSWMLGVLRAELQRPQNFLGPGLDPKVAPHVLGQSRAAPQWCPWCGGL